MYSRKTQLLKHLLMFSLAVLADYSAGGHLSSLHFLVGLTFSVGLLFPPETSIGKSKFNGHPNTFPEGIFIFKLANLTLPSELDTNLIIFSILRTKLDFLCFSH